MILHYNTVTCALNPNKPEYSSKHAFQLIHMDLWGPFHYVTYNGERYFLTIVDDFTRATWVYLLHSKLDTLSMIKNFVILVETQFSTTIQIIRTDNEAEFFSNDCSVFLTSKGILHQSSCAYTPQQNGVVERNRHILEIARSLKIQASLPSKFWGDCVLTAVYLMNRIPTPLLSHKHLLRCCFINHLLIHIFEFLVVYVMHLCFHEEINFLREQSNVFFLDILTHKKAISLLIS